MYKPKRIKKKEGLTMKTLSTLLVFAFVVFALTLASTKTAEAATAINTPIVNTATVNYNVGVTPLLVESGNDTIGGNSTTGLGAGTATQFLVDNLVNLTVVNTLSSTVLIGDTTQQVLAFSVTNNGNGPQRYIFTATAGVNGVDDIFDMDTVQVYVDDALGGGVVGTYDAGIDDLWVDASSGPASGVIAAGATAYVYILADASPTSPVAPADATTSIYWLNAQTVDDAALIALVEDTDGDDETTGEEAVFADLDGPNDAVQDGIHSAFGTYTASSVILNVTKSVSTIWDPYNAGTNPLAIPGSLAQYTITIANTGSGTANLTTIVDALDANLLFNPDHATSLSPTVPTNALGDAYHITIAGSTRAVATTDQWVTSASFGGGSTTLDMTVILPIEGLYLTTGELGGGETLTVTFVAEVL